MKLRYLLLSTAAVVAGPAMAQVQGPPPAAPAPAAAPDASPADTGKINEIVVTAQKRSENVQKVPIAITVVSRDQIAREGITQVQDLSRTSASLEFTSPSVSPGGSGFIRGIGTEALGAGTAASSVAVVVDGVVQGNVPILTLLDIDHVEVLKGPQGTLFGSSVSAGVLNITTLRPNFDSVNGQIFAEIAPSALGSEYQRYMENGSINLPLGDKAAIRVAEQYITNQGMSKDTYNGLYNTDTTAGGRAHLLWEPTNDLTINLFADYTSHIFKNDAGYIYRFAPSAPLTTALADCGIVASPNNTKNCSDYNRNQRLNTGGVSAQVAYDIDNVTLTSITSYRQSRSLQYTDVLGIAAPIARATLGTGCFGFNCNPLASLYAGVQPNKPMDLRESIFSQEVRLASKGATTFQWTVGAYYQRSTYNFNFPSILKLNGFICSLFHLTPDSLGDCILSDPTEQVNTASTDYAFFANGTYNFDDSTRLNAGIRYTHSDVHENISPDLTVSPVMFYSLNVPASAVTFRAALQHDFTPNTMAYVTVSSGYKAPQINDQVPSHLTPVSPERPTSYEIGIKDTAFDGRLAIDADVYYMSIEDFQTESCIPNPATGAIACAQVNVPHVNSTGVEADVFGKPWDGGTINLSASYNSAKYPKNYFGADGTNLQGKQLNYDPPFKLTASIEQRFPVSAAVTMVVGADVTWRDKQSMFLSADPNFTVPSAAIFGARVGAEINDRWSIYFFARNIGNTIYPTALLSTIDFYPKGVWQILDPNSQRVMGIQLRAHF